jgi:hypothetical protein
MTAKIRRTLALLILALLPAAAMAQFDDGGLGQQTQRAMETAMDDLYNAGLGTPTARTFEEMVGKEKVEAFLHNAVVKLTLMPDGAYQAYALEGGEVISFTLGKDQLTPNPDEEYLDGWLLRRGSFKMPKKGQKLTMLLKAGPTEVSVECHNKFSESKEPVTFYVGPLDGLFCVGFTESEEPGKEDQVG